MHISKFLIALTIITSTASCSQKSIQLNTVLNSSQCGFVQHKLVLINSDEQLKQLFNPLSFNDPIKNLKAIDFDASSLILLSMGNQPTAGYSILLNSSTAVIDKGIIKVDAAFKKPLLGSLNAQVLTSPCVLYQMDKHEAKSVELTL